MPLRLFDGSLLLSVLLEDFAIPVWSNLSSKTAFLLLEVLCFFVDVVSKLFIADTADFTLEVVKLFVFWLFNGSFLLKDSVLCKLDSVTEFLFFTVVVIFSRSFWR